MDLRDVPQDAVITADLCIIGAGAAGITLARRMRGQGYHVCLIESGGFEFEPPVQDLYKGENVGLPYWDLDVARLRYFGGATNHWEGMCAPFLPLDFDRRASVPESGWPISYDDVARYYAEAQEICQLGPLRYQLSDWLAEDRRLPALANTVERVYQYGPPTRFGSVYRQELVDAQDVTVLLHANVTEICTDDGGALVDVLRLSTLAGKTATAHAGRYVLACGGIENPRMLLASHRKHPGGIGNAYDQVGRYFMEHYEVWPARATMTIASDVLQPYFGFSSGALYLKPAIVVTPEVQAQRGLCNGGMSLDPIAYQDDATGFVMLRRFLRDVSRGDFDEAGAMLPKVLADLDDVARGTWSKIRGVRYSPAASDQHDLSIKVYGEQVPNPDSRVTLGAARDALGMPRAELDWRLTNADLQSAIASARIVGEGLGAEDAARVRMADWVNDQGWPAKLEGGAHHMGTTRMSATPRTGVVDADCLVHGMLNLYIAGSSLFSTVSYVNPTLTIVAMTLRLGDHLATRMAREGLPVRMAEE